MLLSINLKLISHTLTHLTHSHTLTHLVPLTSIPHMYHPPTHTHTHTHTHHRQLSLKTRSLVTLPSTLS